MTTQATNKNKIALGLLSLSAAVVAIVGIGYAYFSDIIEGNGVATAGTLDISGDITLSQNGTDTEGTSIANFNPGDLIGINASSVTNNGTKSAWIRSVLQFTALSDTPNAGVGGSTEMVGDLSKYLWVCSGGESQSSLIAASFFEGENSEATTDDGFANSPLAYNETTNPTGCKQVTTADITNSTMFGAKATYAISSDGVNGGDVIDGTSEDDDGIEGISGSLPTWTPGAMPEIYFDAAAPNAAQNGQVSFDVLIQALQYRNNTTIPTEAQWETVVDAPFAL